MFDLWSLLCGALLILLIVCLLLICLSDGDLTLMYYAKCGTKMGNLKCRFFFHYCLMPIKKKIPAFFLDSLGGQVVWVTGASTGIGAACAIEAARNGAKVVLSARSKDKLEEVRGQCIGS